MGIGGALIMPATLSIITNVFTDPAERAKAIGIWAGVSALGIGIGPLAGGLLLEHFWWGSVFLVNVPIVIAALVARLLPRARLEGPDAPRLDPLGAVLSIVGLAALLWAIIEAPTKGWASAADPRRLRRRLRRAGRASCSGSCTPTTPCSTSASSRTPGSPRPAAPSRSPSSPCSARCSCSPSTCSRCSATAPSKAGAVLLPQAAMLMIVAPLSAVWVQRFGNKLVVGVGPGRGRRLAVRSSWRLTADSSAVGHHRRDHLMGVGMGNVMAPATDSIMGSLPRAKAGVGSAMNDTTRQIGGAVGVAVLGSILTSRYSSQILTELGGKVPPALAASINDNVSHAVAVAKYVPAAKPYQATIVSAAHTSFMTGLHAATVVAGLVTLIAAAGVFLWLPAKARPQVDDDAPATGGGSPDAAGSVAVDLAVDVPVTEPEALVAVVEALRVGRTGRGAPGRGRHRRPATG